MERSTETYAKAESILLSRSLGKREVLTAARQAA
jgi:hypothetical protein